MTRACLLLVVVAAMTLAGQSPGPQVGPTFEVASVKPNRTETPPSMSVPPRGTVVITNVPVRNVIINAFRVPHGSHTRFASLGSPGCTLWSCPTSLRSVVARPSPAEGHTLNVS